MLVSVSGVLGAIGIFGSQGLPTIANDVLDKACEALFDRKGKEILQQIQLRLHAYTGLTSSIPQNHDLEQAIRLSELTAILVLLRHYESFLETENFDNRAAQTSVFVNKVRMWVLSQIDLCAGLKLKSNNVIVAEINESLDRVLPTTSAIVVEQELSIARDQIWNTLLTEVGPSPLTFEEWFYGRYKDKPGWSTLFLVFMREALKSNPRAEVGFVTTRLSSTREALRRVETNSTLVLAILAAMQDNVSELLTITRQNQLRRHAVQEGLPEALVKLIPKHKYFNTKARELIRWKLKNYCQDHKIRIPTLITRIEDHIGCTDKISGKTLRSFMKGIRVDDSFVAVLEIFSDTLTYPPLPTVVPLVTHNLRVEIAVNDLGECIIFHNRPFILKVRWFEFYTDFPLIKFIMEDGLLLRSFPIPIEPNLVRYMTGVHRVLMVLMDGETGEPIEGDYYPLLVLKNQSIPVIDYPIKQTASA